MNQKKFGTFLKELRKEKGLTQEQLSEYLGVSNRSVSRWETGTNMPDIDLVIELADYFDVSIEELLEGERKAESMDEKTKESLLKVADYGNEERLLLIKRLNILFLIAVAAFIVYFVLDVRGLTSEGVYANIADAALGLDFGMLLVGALFTSRYGKRIRAFKQRMLGRERK